MKNFKSVLAMLLALVLTFSCVGMAFAEKSAPNADAFATNRGSEASFKELKGFKSETFLKNNAYHYTDDQIVRAIVVLEGASESETAERGTQRAAAQRTKLQKQHKDVRKAMSGIKYELAKDFTTLLNGFSCDIAYGDLEKLAALDGVAAVYIANHYAEPAMKQQTRMANSNAYTGIDELYAEGVDGSGMVIAVLDTGTRVTHEVFADADGNCAKTGRLKAEDTVLAAAPGKYVSAKIPFVYDYADEDDNVTDRNGHGTHVAGIALGCAYDAEKGEYTFRGAAAGAQLLGMKIFKDAGGGTSSDLYLAALEDAYRLGADVINMSIGAQNGFTYDAELETVAFGNIYKRLERVGIVLSVAAGNEYSMEKNSALGYIGPEYQDYGTVGSPSTYEGNLSIASMENTAYPAYLLSIGGNSFAYTDASDDGLWAKTFSGKDSVEYVVVPDSTGSGSDIGYGYAADFAKVDVAGKIAVVKRGTITFSEKEAAAYQAGAIGCVVVNNQPGVINMAIDEYHIPAVSVEQSTANYFLKAAEKKLSTSAEMVNVPNSEAYQMSDYSCWGTTPMLTLDPTIASIGGDVYSAINTGDGNYEVMSGTSMAAPNFAGTIATVMQYIDPDGEMAKAERAECAKALLESTAEIATDADGYPYSPRKQGAGIARAAQAADLYTNAGYIIDPIKELGDDAKKTGRYTFDVTITNKSDSTVTYLPETTLLQDYITNINDDETADPVYANNMVSDYIFDFTETYSIDGMPIDDLFELKSGESVTVTVELQLGKSIMAELDEMFQNGTYVEGFTAFYEVNLTDEGELILCDSGDQMYLEDENGAYQIQYDEESGKYTAVLDGEGNKIYFSGKEEDLYVSVLSQIHATFLAFYGDWTKGAVLEATDFRDYAAADYLINTTVNPKTGNTYGKDGYSGLDLLEYYTFPNMVYPAQFVSGKLYDAYKLALGDALINYAPYKEQHIAFSTGKTDADGIYFNGFYAELSQLRNCRNMIMTISDKETGEVYYEDNTPYLPKAYYDDDNAVWRASGAFYWDGRDSKGTYVPSGTIVKVDFDAVLPYKHADDTSKVDGTAVNDVFSFEAEVDYTAPVIESTSYNEATKTLTVKAKDESYLANIFVYYTNEEGEEDIYDAEVFSSEKAGESFTASFDLSELVAAGYQAVKIAALDYASNERNAEVPLFETGKPATFTFVTPSGKTEQKLTTGDKFTFGDCDEEYEGAHFKYWVDQEYEKASASDLKNTFAPGEVIYVSGDKTFYALYGVEDQENLLTDYILPEYDNDFSGDWALVGHFVDDEYNYITEQPIALDSEGKAVDVMKDLNGEYIDAYEFFAAGDSICFTFAASEDGKSYSIRNHKSGKYLAYVNSELTYVDKIDDTALWTIKADNDYACVVIYNVAAPKMTLTFDDGEGEFAVFDDTVLIEDEYVPSEWYAIRMYAAGGSTSAIAYYTTKLCSHSNTEIKNAVAASCESDGYTGDTYCKTCGALLEKGKVIAATGHSFSAQWTIDVPATCTKEGSKSHHCAVCDAKGDVTVIAATGHSWDDGVISKPATCTENGVKTYLCAICNETKTEPIGATGHHFGDWRVTKEATATTKGEKQRVCADCETVETAEIEAIGYSKCYVKSFKDCPEKWYHEAIDFAVSKGLMNGVADYEFDPEGELSRAMVVKVLYRAAGSPEVEEPSTFTDVAKDAWYADAVAWAQDKDVAKGISEDKFAPEAPITREQLATLLWRSAGSAKTEGDLSKFKDADRISNYAKDAMSWAVAEGILNGDNGMLKPRDNTTRAEFTCMIMRYFGGRYFCDELKN